MKGTKHLHLTIAITVMDYCSSSDFESDKELINDFWGTYGQTAFLGEIMGWVDDSDIQLVGVEVIDA